MEWFVWTLTDLPRNQNEHASFPNALKQWYTTCRCQYLPLMNLLLTTCQPTNPFVYLHQCHQKPFHVIIKGCITYRVKHWARGTRDRVLALALGPFAVPPRSPTAWSWVSFFSSFWLSFSAQVSGLSLPTSFNPHRSNYVPLVTSSCEAFIRQPVFIGLLLSAYTQCFRDE